MVSPRLGLMHSRHSAEEWTAALTTMHHTNPEVCATLVTWRRPHHRPQLFAAPEMLQTRATATRRAAQTRSRPSRLMRYRHDLFNISIRGPLGPDPDQLLVAVLQQVHACLGHPLVQGKGEHELDAHMFWDPRDPKGAWTGTLTLYLPDLAETAAVHALLEGAILQVGSSSSRPSGSAASDWMQIRHSASAPRETGRGVTCDSPPPPPPRCRCEQPSGSV